ncbi:hypothetical protein [Sediminibacillus albus]|uniref:Lipoprotein n=1 Tax=Sediminibacillus albus TaxID=407036 RepID=A0A1G8WRL3_9BACI|nr:hypothetical protein [Sediminibacillus albus]SDJ80831.1 hypothetical protein SAMN05216243_0952 [Sediminibacillus albus]
MKRTSFLIAAILIAFLLLSGCTKNLTREEGILAEVSVAEDSSYQATFEELNLGVMLDFYLKLPQADSTLVKLSAEGYQNGEKVHEKPLLTISYGLNQQESEEGHIGMGIINPSGDNTMLTLFAPGSSSQSDNIAKYIHQDTNLVSTWDDALGDTELSLKAGESAILGAYREAENEIGMHDLQDQQSVETMIESDEIVLLLKMKVEKQTEK